MKIAMLGHKAVPSTSGGIETLLTEICPRLSALGNEVVCFNRGSENPDKVYDSEISDGFWRGVRLKSAPALNGGGISAMSASFTAAIAAALGNFDIVHFHAEGPCAAIGIPKLFGKKCVATVHGLDWQRAKWQNGFASKYIRFGERMLARYADEIIVLSESAREYFKKEYGRDTVLIPNGTELPEPVPPSEITKRFSLESGSYLCTMSRLTPEKGIHSLIKAYRNIEKLTDKKLVVAGDGDEKYKSELYKLADGSDKIIFTGFVNGKLRAEIYSNAYLVCMPSELEGMSLTLLEALSYGNALLCSDIPENRDVAKEHAEYFKSRDISSLENSLKRLLEAPAAVAEKKSGTREYIRENYGIDRTVLKTLKLYLSLKKE